MGLTLVLSEDEGHSHRVSEREGQSAGLEGLLAAAL